MSIEDDNRLEQTEAYIDSPVPTSNDSARSDDKTIAYGDEPQGIVDDVIRMHNLRIGSRLELNNTEYRITEIISGENQSGEAVIYKVESDSSGSQVLKLYRELDTKAEPNSEALRRIKQIEDDDILRLIAFGTGPDKYRGKFCYEISTYAEGGDLITDSSGLISNDEICQKYTPEFVEMVVVPQVFRGIKVLHDNKIIHCDLKPQNVFYLDSDRTNLVIGDYGSSKTAEKSDDQASWHTSVVKGTDFYASIEQRSNFIHKKNDFYSMGMILLHLLYPEEIGGDSRHHIYERQQDGRPIIRYDELNPKLKRLNKLIAGLTLLDTKKRWGEKQVSDWIGGADVPVEYGSRATARLNLGSRTVFSVDDLVDYIKEDSNWYDTLFFGGEPDSNLLNFIGSVKSIPQKNMFRRMVGHYAQDGEQFVKVAVLRFLQPRHPVMIGSGNLDFFAEVNLTSKIEEAIRTIDQIWIEKTPFKEVRVTFLDLEMVLRWMYEKSDGPLRNEIELQWDSIAACLELESERLPDKFDNFQAELYLHLDEQRMLKLAYAFNKNRTFVGDDTTSCKDLHEVGAYFARHRGMYDDSRMSAERTAFLKSIKRDKDFKKYSYHDFLLKVFKENVKSELEIKHVELNQPKSGTCTISYRLGRALTDYFEANNINNRLASMDDKDQTVVLKQGMIMSVGGILSRLLKHLKHENQVERSTFNKSSIDRSRLVIATTISTFRKQRLKKLGWSVTDLLDIFYGLRSVLYLLPVFSLVLVLLCTALKDSNACGMIAMVPYLGALYQLPFSIPPALAMTTLYLGYNLIVLICFIPAFVLTYVHRDQITDRKKLRKTIKRLMYFLLLWPVFLSLALYGIASISQTVASVMGYGWRDLQNSAYLFVLSIYAIIGVVRILKTVKRTYEVESRLKILPILTSIALYIVVSSSIFGLDLTKGYLVKVVSAVTESTQSTANTHRNATVIVSAANVRAGASPKFEVLGVVYQGSVVTILSDNGNWKQIQFGELKGYVFAELLKE